VEKITEITPEQEARFPEWVDKWVKVGLNTSPTDKSIGRTAALEMYDAIGYERPSVVIQMSSPYASSMGGAYAVIQMAGLEDGLTLDQIRGRIGTNIKEDIFASVAEQVSEQMKQKFSTSEKTNVKDADLFNVDITGNTVTSNFYGGAFYVSWLAFVTFLRDVMNWENSVLDIIPTYERLCRNAGSVWWHEDVVALSDNPLHIKFDEEERLHCEDGPAIKYADGWSLYSWHGTRVPGKWLTDTKNSLSASEAITWEDIEQRRCACEILGWAVILDELDAVTINDDGDPEIGVLLEVDLPDVGKERFLRVRCGTGRDFCLPVPPDVETALAAQSWTWGIDESEFIKPDVRT